LPDSARLIRSCRFKKLLQQILYPNSLSMTSYSYRFFDRILMPLDQAVRTVFLSSQTSARPNPAAVIDETELDTEERLHSSRLMRVNHTGEICAQALYQGQAMTAKSASVREAMHQSSVEENDHLIWCESRIRQLQGRTSRLNPLFYAGSFIIGAVAGKISDRVSLGFVAETEHQVVRHLDKHIGRLPVHDHKSRIILATMKQEESEHAGKALASGGIRLPLPVRLLMTASSKVMTKTTYWL
jgi:ubiquinone biosynthesis monooxygenase Coq7